MNAKDAQNERLEELLRKAHLPEPSPQLQERITAAAKRAWDQAPQELPWLIPFRRLVASAAAAVLIIWLANCSSDLTLAKWSSGAVHMVSQRPSDIEALPEMPYGPFVRRLACLNRRSSVIDASALKDRIEALRHVLDEAQWDGPTKPPVPTEGRSRLIPNPSSANSCA
jgi:hypothetical protein